MLNKLRLKENPLKKTQMEKKNLAFYLFMRKNLKLNIVRFTITTLNYNHRLVLIREKENLTYFK